jgi:hypothetical protein
MASASPTDDAIRWLRRSYRAGALVDAAAAAGMFLPGLYGPTLRFRRPFRRRRPEFAYALRVGAPLMAGWTALLLWADRQPLQRRAVLPLTIFPVVAGLMANDAHAVRAGYLAAPGVRLVRGLQVSLVALFAYSYMKGEQSARQIAEHPNAD